LARLGLLQPIRHHPTPRTAPTQARKSTALLGII
jgi:hypothetical protein